MDCHNREASAGPSLVGPLRPCSCFPIGPLDELLKRASCLLAGSVVMDVLDKGACAK